MDTMVKVCGVVAVVFGLVVGSGLERVVERIVAAVALASP